jgi:hypothetical protein
MNIQRKENELPMATAEWGWRYHHLGIPVNKPVKGEVYLEKYKLYVSGYDTSPYGIEWMRYEPDSPVDELVKSIPHLAFEVDDLESEIQRHDLSILTPPNSPAEGIRVAMIIHNGAPIELIEFAKNKREQ